MSMKTIFAFIFIFVFVDLRAQTLNEDTHFNYSIVPSFGRYNKESNNHRYHFSLGLFSERVGGILGLELSSFYNENLESMVGNQLSGLINVARKNATGAQVAGLVNIVDSVNGSQIGGLYNISKKIIGAQVAGLVNITTEVKGAQLSGIYNKAGKVRGVQIGLINFADSIDGGAAIGLINIVKKGGHKAIEIAGTDYMNVGVSFKSGTRKVYTIISAGYNFTPVSLFVTGLGVGHVIEINKSNVFSPELIWYSYSDTEFKNPGMAEATHLRFGLSRKISEKIMVSIVPSIYASVKNSKDGVYGFKTNSISPFSTQINSDDKKVEFGFGLGAGVSFLL
jgi:hypothetical protein